EQQLIIEGVLEECKPKTLDPKLIIENQDQDEIEQLLETFKQSQVNVPLIDTLLYMPNHIKDLGEVVRNKRKLEKFEIITLSEECFVILQNKLLKKLKDLRSFTIPCTIGSLTINDTLADLGASINVMLYSMFKKLKMGTPQPTRMSIQLVDRTIR